MMPHEKRSRLIAKLIEMTRANAIQWTVNGLTTGHLFFPAPRSSSLMNEKFEAATDGIKFEITKIANSGVVLMLFDAETQHSKETLHSLEYPILENLYDFVSRASGNFEDKIDAFLER